MKKPLSEPYSRFRLEAEVFFALGQGLRVAWGLLPPPRFTYSKSSMRSDMRNKLRWSSNPICSLLKPPSVHHRLSWVPLLGLLSYVSYFDSSRRFPLSDQTATSLTRRIIPKNSNFIQFSRRKSSTPIFRIPPTSYDRRLLYRSRYRSLSTYSERKFHLSDSSSKSSWLSRSEKFSFPLA